MASKNDSNKNGSNENDSNSGILSEFIFVGGIVLIGYLTYKFFSSLKPPVRRITPTLEDIYRVESHNTNLSPYDMSNVGISIDAKVIDRSSWEVWWITYFSKIPIVLSTGQNILYLEYGKHVPVNDVAYKRAQIGDRIIVWQYTTDGDFDPRRYDIWRNDILIYRRISIFDTIAP